MKNTKNFTLTAMFLAILILLAAVPFLGFIPIGPINATTMHIPVIIASIVLGPKIGGFLGGVFGVISMIRSTIVITPLSFVFSPFIPVIGTDQGSWKAILIAVLPRILIGIVPYYVYKLFKSKTAVQPVGLFVAGFCGSAVNTILVMGGIFLLFKDAYAQAMDISINAVFSVIAGIVFTSGAVEAVVAALATAAVAAVLLRLTKSNATQKL
ncbi:ECF transporter S component [Enterococcus sp. LJL128]|uniref:ECF transporter S component n=1 Tax=Enterococcus sp. LJL51 TaxID=3416656 RepID=UPI003CEDA03F